MTMGIQSAQRIPSTGLGAEFEETIWSHRRGAGFAHMIDGTLVVRLIGCCSHEDLLALCRSIPRWKGRGHRGLVIDFSGTKWHDLVGVRSLVKALVREEEEGEARVCLVRAPLDVRVVLRYMMSPSSIRCVASLQNGMEQVQKPRAPVRTGPDGHLVAVLPVERRAEGS